MGYLIDILIGAATRMVTGELSAHVEPMARWIIGKAVQRFLADDRNRFREEWLAHLDETPGTLRKLWHAVGCYLGAAKVAGVLAQRPPAKEAARNSPPVAPQIRAVLSAEQVAAIEELRAANVECARELAIEYEIVQAGIIAAMLATPIGDPLPARSPPISNTLIAAVQALAAAATPAQARHAATAVQALAVAAYAGSGQARSARERDL